MTVWQLHRWLGQYDAQVKDLSSLSRCIWGPGTTHHQIQENTDIICNANVSFVVVFWLVFLHSNCQFLHVFCQGCLLPAELRRLTSWLKMPPLRRFPAMD